MMPQNLVTKILNYIKSPASKQGLVVLVEQGMMSLVTFVAGVLVARSSEQAEYALYMLGWTLLLSVKGIHESLVNLPFSVYLPRLEDSEVSLYRGSSLFFTIAFCFFSGIIFVFIYYFLKDNSYNISLGLINNIPLLFLVLVSFTLRDFMRNTLLAELSIRPTAIINILMSLLLLFVVVGYYLYGHLTSDLAYLLFVAFMSVAAGIMFRRTYSKSKINISYTFLHFKRNWNLGKWALLGNFAYIGSRQSYPWLILYFLDSTSVAIYYACLSLALAPAPILRGAGAYILPRMSHGYDKDSHKNLYRIFRKSVVFLSIPFIFWFLIGSVYSNELINLVYDEMFHQVGYLLFLLLIMTVIDFSFSPLTNALQVLEKTKDITVSLFLGALVTLVLGSILIKEFQLYGAGFASVISMIVTIGWRYYVFIKVIRNKL